MLRTKRPYLILVILLTTVAMLLAACGDAATSTPAPTTTAAAATPTTAPATTAPTTTVIPTTTSVATATPRPATSTAAPTATTTVPAATTAMTAGTGSTNFKPFVSQTGNFSVLLPFVPREQNIPYNLVTSDSDVDTHFFDDPKAGGNGISYAVIYGVIAKDVETRLGVKGILDSALHEFVQQSNLKLLSQKDIVVGGLKGIEAETSHDASYDRVRLFYSNNRLYELLAGGSQSDKDAPEFNTFLDSFHIINSQPTTPAATVALPAAVSPNLTEIIADPALTTAFTKKYPKVSNVSVKWYVSNQAVADLVTAADSNLIKAGYHFDLPGSSQPAKAGANYAAIYTKIGAPDLVITFTPTSADVNELSTNVKKLGLPGLDGLDYNKLAAQVKNSKSFVMMTTGNNLLQGVSDGQDSGDTSSTPNVQTASATPATATTTPDSNPGSSEITVDPAVKAAFAKKFPGVFNLQIEWKVSDAPIEKVLDDNKMELSMIDDTATFSKTGSYYSSSFTFKDVDAVIAIAPISDSSPSGGAIGELEIPGMAQIDANKFTAQVKGKKTFIMTVSGIGLAKALQTSTPPPTGAANATLSKMTEIPVDPAITAELVKESQGSVKDLSVKLFVSDEAAPDLATAENSTLLNTGYTYAIPNEISVKQYNANDYHGGYSKAGTADILFVAGGLSNNPAQLTLDLKNWGFANLDQVVLDKLAAQVKGKQSLLVVVTGTGFLKAAYNS